MSDEVQKIDNEIHIPQRTDRMMDLSRRVRQEFTHLGFLYSVTDLCDAIDAGMKPKDAVRHLYPSTPAASLSRVVSKLKKHPYYIARRDIELAIIREKSADLQTNLLDLAFNAKSEMVRYSATGDALNRIHGDSADDKTDDKPRFVFNFNMGGQNIQLDTAKADNSSVIDVEAIDG